MPPYTPCPVPEYSASCLPNKVSSRWSLNPSTDWIGLVTLTQVACCRMTLQSMSPTQHPLLSL
jgi:hypothetical protein